MSSFLLFSSRGWSLLLERSRDRERLRDRSRWPVGAFAPKRSARAASRAPKSPVAGAGAGTSKRDFLAGAAVGAAAAADIPKVAEPQSSSASSDAGAGADAAI